MVLISRRKWRTSTRALLRARPKPWAARAMRRAAVTSMRCRAMLVLQVPGYATAMVMKVIAGLRTAVVVPLFFFFTLFIAATVTVVAVIRPNSPMIERIIRVWSRAFLGAAGSRFTTEGQDKVDVDGQYVFVANHLSNLDIPVMFLTAPVPIRYLSKKEVYKIPILATAMRKIGMVKVDREGGNTMHTEVNTGVAAAKARGHSLIIFAEAHRSVTGELRPFKKGAFRIAIANDLPVVPIAIDGTWEVWPPGSKLFFPGRVSSRVHDPIPTENLDLTDITELRTKVHEIISASYQEMRDARVARSQS